MCECDAILAELNRQFLMRGYDKDSALKLADEIVKRIMRNGGSLALPSVQTALTT